VSRTLDLLAQQHAARTRTNPHADTPESIGAVMVPASSAQGDILFHDGTAYARLPAGTAGQHLQTAGAGANPAWSSAVKASEVQVSGTKVLGAQQGAIADAVTAHACADLAEVNSALNALGGKINSILAALRTHGIIAT